MPFQFWRCFNTTLYRKWTLGHLFWVLLTLCISVVPFFLPEVVLRTGTVANIFANLTFLLACKNSIVKVTLGIPFERALWWHKFFAMLTLG